LTYQAISASGAAVEIERALRLAGAAGHVLAVARHLFGPVRSGICSAGARPGRDGYAGSAMNTLATIDADLQTIGEPEATAEPSGLGCLVIIARHHGLDLSVSQLAEQRQGDDRELSIAELLKVAKSVGLQARSLRPDWKGLVALSKALPVLVTLKNGRSMVLTRLELDNEPARVVLEDPNAGDDALLIIDRTRFESAWSGDVVLIRRNYDLRDEAQPFSIRFVRALIFGERRIVRDIAICALVLGFLSLLPIMFWQVLTIRVLGYKALSTFYFVVLAMVSVIALDAVFRWIRQFLIIHLTARVDVKLNTYIFDKLIGLPIDFFERNQIGAIMTVYYYHQLSSADLDLSHRSVARIAA
jgi:ATP-binding cassette, subfamily B, bacterial HlyB/CyaB